MLSTRPTPGDYAEFYHTYVQKVPSDISIIACLEEALKKTSDWLNQLPADQWEYRYAAGKWSIKELVLHLIDAERIFAYRALRIARNDQTLLADFDENSYVPFSQADRRSPQSLIDEYMAVRSATISLFRNLPDEAWSYSGNMNHSKATTLALAYIIAGHEMHHWQIIRERYLQSSQPIV
ncbi:MAG TPA: DinB family protein [Saprospiraceae bacterium]|nr:DinB family protein [Saprospiraceae bacterium]HMQ81641.1 DinB family protein [Saprospiraceae bacterium]